MLPSVNAPLPSSSILFNTLPSSRRCRLLDAGAWTRGRRSWCRRAVTFARSAQRRCCSPARVQPRSVLSQLEAMHKGRERGGKLPRCTYTCTHANTCTRARVLFFAGCLWVKRHRWGLDLWLLLPLACHRLRRWVCDGGSAARVCDSGTRRSPPAHPQRQGERGQAGPRQEERQSAWFEARPVR